MLSPLKMLLPIAAAAALVVCGVTAATPVHAATAQQEKMKTCNADATAKSLSGAARRSYMKGCLSKEGKMSAMHNSQQERMKSCNADAKAKALKGADRKHFMSACLKGR